jgi:hypothetical protein
VCSHTLGTVIVLDDLHSELKGGLRGCLEDLGILSTVLLAHDTREEEAHVDLLCHIEEEAWAIICGELCANFLEAEVVFTAGLQKELVEEEGLVELHVPLHSAQRI